MLAHPPLLPFIIDYQDDGITVEDEEGAILALKQHDHVRRVCLLMPVASLQKLIVAMDDEYLILENLIIGHQERDTSSILIFPKTLQAPHLCHFALSGITLPIGSRSRMTAVGPARPPTSIQILCSNGYHLCHSLRPSFLSLSPPFPTVM